MYYVGLYDVAWLYQKPQLGQAGSHESLAWTGGLDCDLIIFDIIIKFITAAGLQL